MAVNCDFCSRFHWWQWDGDLNHLIECPKYVNLKEKFNIKDEKYIRIKIGIPPGFENLIRPVSN